jgi:alkaline phosphatase
MNLFKPHALFLVTGICSGSVFFSSAIFFSSSVFASDSVPTNAKEWFAAGKEKVRATKRINQQALSDQMRRAKNVILFIGDGMGVSTVTAARILAGQLKATDGEYHRLSFETLPYMALSVTASANQQTSDSAPTATAIVSGIKTNDGAISVDQTIDRNEISAEVTASKSVKTILERAEQKGLSTGVVTTARLTHATPAVNYAHISNRDWEADASLPVGATVKDIAVVRISLRQWFGGRHWRGPQLFYAQYRARPGVSR